MKEEIKDEKLESLIKEVSRNFSNKPWNNSLREIFERGGGTLLNKEEENSICTFYTEWGEKYVKFYGKYKENTRSLKELKPLIDYLDKEGYKWI
jgi:phosphoglycolate phosphatase-like HAD superfamily hydrolase